MTRASTRRSIGAANIATSTGRRAESRGATMGGPVLQTCPICRTPFKTDGRNRKCDACRAAEDAHARTLAGSYQPAFRGPLPKADAGHVEPRAHAARRGGGSGSAGRYRLVLDIADGADGTYSLVSAWPNSAPPLQWFRPTTPNEDVIVTRDGRRFDVGLSLEDLFRRAYQLGNAIHHDRYRLLVDGPDIACHCNGLSELQRAAILVRVLGEYWGAMQGADFGVDIAGLMARVGLKLGHGAHLSEGQT